MACWWKGREDMLIEYRLEKVDPKKTAEIEKKKEEQKDKQEKAWNDEQEDQKPTRQKTGDSLNTEGGQLS
jgi:hypothetical protein